MRGLLAAGAVALAGLVPLVAPVAPASAASSDSLSATVTFSCKIATFPAYTWKPTVTISALRPAGSSAVTLTGTLTKMAGASPVAMNYDLTSSLVLAVDGSAVTATGDGHVQTTAGYQQFELPSVTASFSSSGSDLTVKVTSYSFAMDPTGLNMKGLCTPTAGATFATTLTPSDGVAPTPSVTPTTMSSATAKPRVTSSSAAPSATPASGSAGTAAKGQATFSCLLNQTNSKFKYAATIKVSGYRASSSGPVVLSATMSDIPGIAPVVVDGTMDVTLGLTVGGKAAKLTGSTHAKADPYQVVPVPTLSGSVAASGDDLKVVATSFRFDFPDMSIDADCTSSGALSTLTVGTDAAAARAAGTAGTAGGSSTLPKTGADHLGLMLAWAAGLIALGGSGLVLLRRIR